MNVYENELLPREYIAKKDSEFHERYKSNSNIEDEWNKLRSQLNSGLMLRIPQNDIDRYATLDYTYEQREVIKYSLFVGISNDILEKILSCQTWGEMVKELDASKVGEEISRLIDKTMNTISQTLEKHISIFSSFRTETEMKKAEYENRIAELELMLAENEDERKRLLQVVKEKEEMVRKNQERISAMANKRHYVEPAAEQKENRQQHMKHTSKNNIFESIFKKRERKTTENWTFKPEKLSSDFDLSVYMMQMDLSSSQMEIITFAVKAGIDDSIIKQMIDSRLPAQQMRQVLEVIIVRSMGMDTNAENNIREDNADDE